MQKICAFLLLITLASVSQWAFIFDLTSIDDAGCVFNVESTSDIFDYYLGIKAINGTISTSGISWPSPTLLNIPGHVEFNSNYDFTFAASQMIGGPVGANTLVFDIGSNSEIVTVDTTNYMPGPTGLILLSLGDWHYEENINHKKHTLQFNPARQKQAFSAPAFLLPG